MSALKAVKVIGKTYSIVYATGKPLAEDELGELDPDKQQITIKKGQPLETEQDTLLHEICHALDNELALKLSEKQVRGIATGILAVLKDNKTLDSYLRRKR